MKTRYKIGMGLVALIVVFVLADRFVDRTPFVQQLLDDVSQDAPYHLKLAHIDHSFLSPGLVNVDDFIWQDDFGNKVTIKHFQLAIEVPALFYKKVEVKLIGVDGVALDFSEQGLAELANAMASPKTEQAESSEPLPIKLVELEQLIIEPVKLHYQAEATEVVANNVVLDISQFSFLKEGVFNLDELKGLLKFRAETADVSIAAPNDSSDKTSVELAVKNLNLLLDINQTHPSQISLKDLSIDETVLSLNLQTDTVPEDDTSIVEEAGEEVKQTSQKIADEVIKLPLDLVVEHLVLKQVNIKLQHNLQTYQADNIKVELNDWQLTDNKQVIIEKIKGQLAVNIDKISQNGQLALSADDVTDAAIEQAKQTETESLAGNQAEVTESLDNTTALKETIQQTQSKLILNQLALQLDVNQTQTGQVTLQQLTIADVEVEFNIANPPVADDTAASNVNQATTTATSVNHASDRTEAAGFKPIAVPFNLVVKQAEINQLNANLTLDQQTYQIKQLKLGLNNWILTQDKQIEIDKIKGDLALSINQLIGLGYQADQLKLSANVADSKVDLVELDLQVFDGELNLAADINYSAPYQINLNRFLAKNMKAKINLLQPADSEAAQQVDMTQSSATETTDTTETAKQVNDEDGKIKAVNSLFVQKIGLDNINIELFDPEQNKAWLKVDNFFLALNEFPLIKDHQLIQIKDLRPGNQLDINLAKVSYLSSVIESIVLHASTMNQGVELTQSGFVLDKGELVADAKLVLNNKIIDVDTKLDWQNLNLDRIQAFVKESPIKPIGLISGHTDGIFKYDTTQQGVAALSGEINLNAENFDLQGIALDKLIDGFRASQETSLLDVGSFIVGGPLGVMAMKFAQLGAGAVQMNGETQVKSVSFDTKIDNSIVELKKATFNTKGNRLGFYGKVNLNDNRFQKLRFGILNKAGCASVQQTLDGPFSEVKDLLFNTTSGAVTSPLSSVFRQASNLANGACTPFFSKNEKAIQAELVPFNQPDPVTEVEQGSELVTPPKQPVSGMPAP